MQWARTKPSQAAHILYWIILVLFLAKPTTFGLHEIQGIDFVALNILIYIRHDVNAVFLWRVIQQTSKILFIIFCRGFFVLLCF